MLVAYVSGHGYGHATRIGEVLRRVRAQPDLADLPCIAVSADAMPQQIARARAAGFDDYWVKPLDVPTLADRVLQRAPRRPRQI